jgi:hypothetical protein
MEHKPDFYVIGLPASALLRPATITVAKNVPANLFEQFLQIGYLKAGTTH